MGVSDEYLHSVPYSFTIVVVVLLFTFIQVVYVHSPAIKMIQKEHEAGVRCSEGAVGGPASNYVERLPQIADNGLTSDNVAVWGNSASRWGAPGRCAEYRGSEEYGHLFGGPASGFLGGPEPPVFYDMGDVGLQRDTRNASAADWNATDEYGRKYFLDSNIYDSTGIKVGSGQPRYLQRNVYCNANPDANACAAYKSYYCDSSKPTYAFNSKTRLCGGVGGMSASEGMRMKVNEGLRMNIDEGFLDDNDLARASR